MASFRSSPPGRHPDPYRRDGAGVLDRRPERLRHLDQPGRDDSCRRGGDCCSGAGTALAGGLTGAVVLNGDASNPSIQNPSIQNPSIQNPDIQVAEVYNPNITSAFVANPSIQNPSIQNVVLNPSIQNPSIQNPSIQNPSLQNDAVANLSVVNPSIQNPSIQNPSIQNPSLQNPSIQNADVVSGAIEDTTWVVTQRWQHRRVVCHQPGDQRPVPTGFGTPVHLPQDLRHLGPEDCTLADQPHTILLANIPNPTFTTPQNAANPSIQNPSIQNPTISLAPGESADVTLRITDPNRFDGAVVRGRRGGDAGRSSRIR